MIWDKCASGGASARFCTSGDFSPTDAVNTPWSLDFSLAGLLSLSNHLTIQKANISIGSSETVKLIVHFIIFTTPRGLSVSIVYTDVEGNLDRERMRNPLNESVKYEAHR